MGYTPLFADMDGDRYPELLWAADYFTSSYLRNDGGGGFTDITEQSGTGLDANGMGAAAADLDNDGRLDLVQTNGWEGHNGRDDPSPSYVSLLAVAIL